MTFLFQLTLRWIKAEVKRLRFIHEPELQLVHRVAGFYDATRRSRMLVSGHFTCSQDTVGDFPLPGVHLPTWPQFLAIEGVLNSDFTVGGGIARHRGTNKGQRQDEAKGAFHSEPMLFEFRGVGVWDQRCVAYFSLPASSRCTAGRRPIELELLGRVGKQFFPLASGDLAANFGHSDQQWKLRARTVRIGVS